VQAAFRAKTKARRPQRRRSPRTAPFPFASFSTTATRSGRLSLSQSRTSGRRPTCFSPTTRPAPSRTSTPGPAVHHPAWHTLRPARRGDDQTRRAQEALHLEAGRVREGRLGLREEPTAGARDIHHQGTVQAQGRRTGCSCRDARSGSSRPRPVSASPFRKRPVCRDGQVPTAPVRTRSLRRASFGYCLRPTGSVRAPCPRRSPAAADSLSDLCCHQASAVLPQRGHPRRGRARRSSRQCER
jgi:hypothetical protein